MLFTERKKLSFKYPAAKVDNVKWFKGSEGRIASQFDHSSTANIYAGISPYGMTLSYEVAGTTGLKTLFQKNRKPCRLEYHLRRVWNCDEETLHQGSKRIASHGRSLHV